MLRALRRPDYSRWLLCRRRHTTTSAASDATPAMPRLAVSMMPIIVAGFFQRRQLPLRHTPCCAAAPRAAIGARLMPATCQRTCVRVPPSPLLSRAAAASAAALLPSRRRRHACLRYDATPLLTFLRLLFSLSLLLLLPTLYARFPSSLFSMLAHCISLLIGICASARSAALTPPDAEAAEPPASWLLIHEPPRAARCDI